MQNWLVPVIRRASYRWPPRNEALKRARVERGLYKCAQCSGIFSREFVVIDHKIPVVGSEGFTTWDEYIERMFCNVDNFQILCFIDHEIKTKEEAHARKAHRDKLKEQKKNDNE